MVKSPIEAIIAYMMTTSRHHVVTATATATASSSSSSSVTIIITAVAVLRAGVEAAQVEEAEEEEVVW